MTDTRRSKYLGLYAEPMAGQLTGIESAGGWQHCVVIPAYRESSHLLDKLANMNTDGKATLVILVINRPDNAPLDCNQELLAATRAYPTAWIHSQGEAWLVSLTTQVDLLVIDRGEVGAPLPVKQGVGLARKIGADCAVALFEAGVLNSTWIHCTDADATLPADYFRCSERGPDKEIAALVHPYNHRALDGGPPGLATQVYESWLHHYANEVDRAGSPYGFHTLGSCISVQVDHYCGVRGFPLRAASEDFYLLNKLAKTGQILNSNCTAIVIDERLSDRVPFGTGPPVIKLELLDDPRHSPMFYDAACFHALRCWLRCWPAIFNAGAVPTETELASFLCDADQGGEPNPGDLYGQAARVLVTLGIPGSIAHSLKQSSNYDAFARHMHQAFDAFKTLKLIRGLALPRLSYFEAHRRIDEQ